MQATASLAAHAPSSQAPARHIAIVGGSGGIGASVALAAVNAGQFDVDIVVRPERVAHFQAHGLAVTAGDQRHVILPSSHPSSNLPGMVRFVGSVAEVPSHALVATCVRNDQLAGSLHGLQDHTVVLFQNGLGHLEASQAQYPHAQFHASVVYFAAAKRADGSVVTNGGHILVGQEPQALHHALSGQDLLEVRPAPDMDAVIFMKAALNCALNPVATMFQSSISELVSSVPMQRLIRGIVAEVCAVGVRKGAFGNAEQAHARLGVIVDEVMTNIRAAVEKYPSHPTSMQTAFRCGQPTEIPNLNRYIAAAGGDFGIDTPLNARIAERMEYFERLRAACPDERAYYAAHGAQMRETIHELTAMAALAESDLT